MTRSLSLKLVLAFVVVSITGAALAAVFARWVTGREFDRLVLDAARSDFLDEVVTYHELNGSLTGIAGYLPRPAPPVPAPSELGAEDQPPAPPQAAGELKELRPPPFSFVLIDADGYVVVPGGQYGVGSSVGASEMERGVAVEVSGQVIGTVLTLAGPTPLNPREERYLVRTRRALLCAALSAAAVSLVLGIVLARTLTQPLRELTTAIRAVSTGTLAQKVTIRSRDELGELASAFNQMSADLARSNDLRRQMTADIAHDLRTPLTVISGYLESLRDGVLAPSPARFDAMYSEAQHLQRLVEDLRTLSLADAGELPLNREPVPPHTLLDRLVMAHRHLARQRGIDLRCIAESDLPAIHVDPDRLMQVLGNLISNAIRFTSEGGEITVSAAERGDRVTLSVADTGVGIAADELPRIFDRSYRGDEARQGDEGESGLGLAIAKSLVELHDGTIAVESTLGEGSMFTVSLPRCQSDQLDDPRHDHDDRDQPRTEA